MIPIREYLFSGYLLGLYMREDGKLFTAWRKLGQLTAWGFGEVEPERFWKFVNENKDNEFVGHTI